MKAEEMIALTEQGLPVPCNVKPMTTTPIIEIPENETGVPEGWYEIADLLIGYSSDDEAIAFVGETLKHASSELVPSPPTWHDAEPLLSAEQEVYELKRGNQLIGRVANIMLPNPKDGHWKADTIDAQSKSNLVGWFDSKAKARRAVDKACIPTAALRQPVIQVFASLNDDETTTVNVYLTATSELIWSGQYGGDDIYSAELWDMLVADANVIFDKRD